MSVFSITSNSHARAMNFSRLLIPVIKTSRSHRCHARWRSSSGSTVFRSAFSRANSFVSPSGRVDRYSMGSTEDLGGSTPSRYESIVIEARGSARGSSSAIVVLLDSQIFVRGEKKRLVLTTSSLQLHTLRVGWISGRKRRASSPSCGNSLAAF